MLLGLGVIGSYVWRTYENTKRRPSYIPMSHERLLTSPAARFVMVGAANTAVTGAAFLALLTVMHPDLAFTIVYVCGILFVTVVTPRFVFSTRPSHARRAGLAAWDWSSTCAACSSARRSIAASASPTCSWSSGRSR
jgi:hypothetical protein